MRLLVLGAKGMLGQVLANEFSHANYEVAAWDRAEIDITDQKQILEKIGALRPDIIINAAAYNNVDRAENEDRDLAMKVNGEAVGFLKKAAADCGALFVHYSTDYVFKGDKVDGYKEDDMPNPQSWYGRSKYEGEKKILDFRFKIADFKFYLIRTSRLFGPAGAGEGAKKSFVETMLKLGKEKGELDVIDEEVSSPTYVVDLARATLDLIDSGASYGIYHRTNEGVCTWYNWAKKIFELANLSVKINPVPASKYPRPAPRPQFSQLISTKLSPLRSWEKALEGFLKI